MHSIDLTAIAVGPTEFGHWAALNAPLGLDAFGINVAELDPRNSSTSSTTRSKALSRSCSSSSRGGRASSSGDETDEAGPGTAVGIGDPAVMRGFRGTRAGHARALHRCAAAEPARALGLLDQRRRAVTCGLAQEPVASVLRRPPPALAAVEDARARERIREREAQLGARLTNARALRGLRRRSSAGGLARDRRARSTSSRVRRGRAPRSSSAPRTASRRSTSRRRCATREADPSYRRSCSPRRPRRRDASSPPPGSRRPRGAPHRRRPRHACPTSAVRSTSCSSTAERPLSRRPAPARAGARRLRWCWRISARTIPTSCPTSSMCAPMTATARSAARRGRPRRSRCARRDDDGQARAQSTPAMKRVLGETVRCPPPFGADHRDPRPGALQHERDRAAVGRVDREVEQRLVPGDDVQRVRAAAVGAHDPDAHAAPCRRSR